MSEPTHDYRDEAIRRRHQLKTAKGENARLLERIAALEAERDQAVADAEELAGAYEELEADFQASPSEWQAKALELEGQLAARDHKDAWREAVTDLHEKASIDDLWAKLGYTPEGDVDAEKITELVAGAREASPYLFKATGETPSQPETGRKVARPLQPGPGSDRGGAAPAATRLRVNRSDMRNPEWMRNHQAEYAQHAAAGTLDLLD